MLTIPIREIVAGEACLTSSVSKMKFTLFPNWILQPDGRVKSLKVKVEIDEKMSQFQDKMRGKNTLCYIRPCQIQTPISRSRHDPSRRLPFAICVCQPTALSVISADDPRGGGAPQVHHAGARSRAETDKAPQSRVPAHGARARSIPQEGTTC